MSKPSTHKGKYYHRTREFAKCEHCGKEFQIMAGTEHLVCSHECSTALSYKQYWPIMKEMAYHYVELGWGLRSLARKYNLMPIRCGRILKYCGIKIRPNNSRGWTVEQRRAFSRGSTSWNAIQGEEEPTTQLSLF